MLSSTLFLGRLQLSLQEIAVLSAEGQSLTPPIFWLLPTAHKTSCPVKYRSVNLDANVKTISTHCASQVVTGEHDTSDPLGDTHHNVKSIVDHPSYDIAARTDYDFSILTIDCNQEIDLTDKARAACLPESGRDWNCRSENPHLEYHIHDVFFWPK